MAIGARFMQNFLDGLPLVAHEGDLWPWPWLLEKPSRFLLGWPFSLTLLAILLTHELGHYFACRYHGVRCTLPWVLPAPTLSGTVGAVIRIRSRIPDRRVLMDIGVYGPIAGYAASLIVAAVGIHLSSAAPQYRAAPAPAVIAFSHPLTLRFMQGSLAHLSAAAFSPISPRIDLTVRHPVLLAAWIGLFITSLNLIPCGQLDGGHILYSLSPRLHRAVSLTLPFLFLAAAWFYWIGWAVWGLILLLPAMRHPRVPIDRPLDFRRLILGLSALAIFVLTLTLAPFADSSLSALVH